MKKREKQIQNEIKALIDNEEIQVPDSLSQNKIENLLKSAKQDKKATSILKIIVPVAAAVAVIAVSLTAGIKYLNSAPQKNVTLSGVYNQSYGDAPIKDAKNYEEIEKYFLSIKKQYVKEEIKNQLRFSFSFGQKKSNINSMETPESSGGTDASSNPSNSSNSENAMTDSYGSTNVQVDGIDEADILKNDGKNLYVVSNSAKKLFIIDAASAEKMQIASEVPFKENQTIDEIYLKDSKVITIGTAYDYFDEASGETIEIYKSDQKNERTVITIYNASNGTDLKELKQIEIDGSKISTRLSGNKLIAACSYSVPLFKEKETLKKRCIPSYYSSGEQAFVPFENIKILDDLQSESNYLVIGIIDLSSISQAPEMTAVLGGGENAYCDSNNIYFTRSIYSKGTETVSADGEIASYTPGKASTGIFMFDITGMSAEFKAYGTVDGTVDDQFSMDKHGEYFRIATTDNADGSNITVLDKELKKVGEITGLSKGERIYAVRFMGDTAYVITFRQTDPLLIIDLSDPKNPKLLGELKIPGFSDYLHPYSENLLIGVGYDGTESGLNGNMKVSLFDVSDPKNPKEVSKIIFNGNSVISQAAGNHKAFLWLGDTKEFAIPVLKYNNNRTSAYLCIMSVGQDNKLNITGSYGENSISYKEDNPEIFRGTYIGNTIFTISENQVAAYNRSSQEKISSVLLTESAQAEAATGTNEYNDTVY